MKKYLSILKKCPLFYDIPEENLLRLLICLGAKVKVYAKKEVIIAEGDSTKNIGIMLSGSAQMIRVDYYGYRSIVSTIETADLFGEAFACAEVASAPVEVVANTGCEIMLIDCQHVMHTCTNACGFHHQMIFNLMKDLASKNLMYYQKIEVVSKRSTREKLMTYLMQQAERANNSSFDIPFDRQELADYLEVERSGLSVEISKLRKEGLVNNNKNHFEILSREMLGN